MILFALVCCILALVPCVLFIRNLRVYSSPSTVGATNLGVSVLIPARNEEANIGRAIESVLANRDISFEIIVMDDHSEDQTPAIVAAMARKDSRIRLERAPALPPGWCGKQHACATLARRAIHPLLCFMDADVRLEPNALRRMSAFLVQRQVDLVSGVPRQELSTFWEKLLLPLIHFVLLGFLPMRRMRASTAPAYAAGCGQLFLARADAYRDSGGHAAIRASLHDGIKLPRNFREQGFKTDLFDATDIARCRMYANGREVFAGLAKNATEGLAAPRLIVPVSGLLFFGQVVPIALLFWSDTGGITWTLAMAGTFLGVLPRWLACVRFQQPLLGALLHPIGILVLIAIQWAAFGKALLRQPAVWRGRTYGELRMESTG